MLKHLATDLFIANGENTFITLYFLFLTVAQYINHGHL